MIKWNFQSKYKRISCHYNFRAVIYDRKTMMTNNNLSSKLRWVRTPVMENDFFLKKEIEQIKWLKLLNKQLLANKKFWSIFALSL